MAASANDTMTGAPTAQARNTQALRTLGLGGSPVVNRRIASAASAPSPRFDGNSRIIDSVGAPFCICTAMWAGSTASAYSHQWRGGASRNTANIVAFGSQKMDVGSDGNLSAKPTWAPA